MEYRKFGKTDVVVSRIGLGAHMFPLAAADWHGYHGKGIRQDVDYKERRRLVERALELGVVLYDCDFDFEKDLMGRIVEDLNVRDRVSLASWVDYRPETAAEVDWGQFDRAFDRVLQLLRCEYLDILNWRFGRGFAHTSFAEDFRGHTEGLKSAGKLRATAFYTGDGSDELILEAAATASSDALFRGFGLLNPQVRERVLPLAAAKDLGFLAFIPFQKGWFFECATEAGLMGDGGDEIAQLGLKWVLQHPEVNAVLVGVSTEAELETNCGAAVDEPLCDSEIETLMTLTYTRAYDRFIDSMRKENPAILRDWREVGAVSRGIG
jgi:aryl-alcohol dehydrogenase-like predicted oxidoreductase